MWRGSLGKIFKAFHGHGIREDNSSETQLLSQQGVYNGRREGGRLTWRGVQSRDVQMSSHHGPNAGLNHGAKRLQFQGVQSLAVVQDAWQGQM